MCCSAKARLDFTAEYNGNVTLNVGSYDGAFGCYAARVEISFL